MPIRKVNRAMWRIISWYFIYRRNGKSTQWTERQQSTYSHSYSLTSWHRAFPHDVKVAIFLFQNMGYSLYIVFSAALPFLLIPPRLISKFVWKLAKEIGLQIGIKSLSFHGSPANGRKSNAKYSRFYTNRNLTETLYHWSVILRRINVVSILTVHNVKVL